MWVFTKYGFFSAVCARMGNGTHGQPLDPDRIMIRARVREHLEALADRFPDLIGAGKILDSTGTDYAYRIFLPKAVWAQVLAALAEEIDYDNFKSKVAQHQEDDGGAYEHSLHEVWTVMRTLQKRRKNTSTPTARQIDALLPFLDRLMAEGFTRDKSHIEPSPVTGNDLSETVDKFEKALYKHDWVKPGFNWPQWQQEAATYVDSLEKVASADVETLRRLLTTHVRKERFCEGHLAEMVQNGHIAAILSRLRELRETTS